MRRTAVVLSPLTLLGLVLWTGSCARSHRENLSDYFVIEYVPSVVSLGRRELRAHIYVRNLDGKLQYLGTGYPDPGLELERASRSLATGTLVAVSQDGRSIVFRHFPHLAKGDARLAGGIYHYEHGKGPKLLHSERGLGVSWTLWPKPIPRTVFVFEYMDTVDPQQVRWAVTTEGEEFPLALLGGTPLHRAAYEGRLEKVAGLLRNEDMNARTYWGLTPLDVAIVRGHEPVAVFLMERGADITAREHSWFVLRPVPASPALQHMIREYSAHRSLRPTASDK
jgi:hypothetical protein